MEKVIELKWFTWNENRKNAIELFIKLSKKTSFLGLKNKWMFVGKTAINVLIKQMMAICSFVNRTLKDTIWTINKISIHLNHLTFVDQTNKNLAHFNLYTMLTTHQILETLSSKTPLATGNSRWRSCFKCSIDLNQGAQIIPNVNSTINPMTATFLTAVKYRCVKPFTFLAAEEKLWPSRKKKNGNAWYNSICL